LAVYFKVPVAQASINSNTDIKLHSQILDVKIGNIEEGQLRDFIYKFTAFFYGYDILNLQDNVDFLDDLEAHVYTEGKGGEVKYGKLFIDFRNPENSGLSDRGLSHYLFLNGILDAMGIDIKIEKEKEIEEERIGSSKTLGDFISNMLILLRKYNKII